MNDNKNNITEISDLMDFYRAWPDLKKHAVELKDNINMSKEARQTLYWLIELADRVGKADIEPLP